MGLPRIEWQWNWNDWPHSRIGDYREPSITFSLSGELYGIFFPSIVQNIEVALVLGLTALIAVAVSRVIYKVILQNGKHDNNTAYLLGYGLILPFWILSPMLLIKLFNIQNAIFRFVMGTVPPLAMFRTMEAIHGFCPAYATQSVNSFALYYSSPFLVRYDDKEEKFVKATSRSLLRKFLLFIRGSFLIGAIHSLYLQFPATFIQFGGGFFNKDHWYSTCTIFRWRRLWENLCFAVFFQTYLLFCGFGLQLTTMVITGLELEEMWLDPLSKSVSFTDFWSRRWNLSVHTTLKRGVFMPVRRYFSKYTALLATFLASGLFHEWLIWIVFSPLDPDLCPTKSSAADKWKRSDSTTTTICHQPTYGPAIVFFLFQAILIAVEFLGGKYLTCFTSKIPTPIATLAVVSIGGCVAHWFSEAYIHSNFFVDSRVAYVLVKRLDEG